VRERPQKEQLELWYRHGSHMSTKNSSFRLADEANPAAKNEKGGDENQEIFPA